MTIHMLEKVGLFPIPQELSTQSGFGRGFCFVQQHILDSLEAAWVTRYNNISNYQLLSIEHVPC